MFIYFHLNKTLGNKKGQTVPLFIAFIVVVIIMSLVTVNLSKISFVRTDASNSADSGGLAAGASMAQAFNVAAIANSNLNKQYWTFFTGISVSFILALIQAALVIVKASAAMTSIGTTMASNICTCVSPICCAAVAPNVASMGIVALALEKMLNFRVIMIAIGLAITAFTFAQHYAYKNIRKQAKQGRRSAIKNGHGFVFSNSGTGSKLKEGRMGDYARPADDKSDANNFRKAYTDFLDDISSIDVRVDSGDQDPAESYTYSWTDGDSRAHSVTSSVHIEPVDKFDVKVALLPSLAETALLLAVGILAWQGKVKLALAETELGAASAALDTCCVESMACFPPYCAGCGPCAAAAATAMVALGAAETALGSVILLVAIAIGLDLLAWAGLIPTHIMEDRSGDIGLMWIICWIDDIDHDRLVRVDTDQTHAGAALAGWNSTYPSIHSYCKVSFAGTGQIRPTPVPKHDADIMETDQIGTGS